jgi:hypothetical protein
MTPESISFENDRETVSKIPRFLFICDKTLEHLERVGASWKELNPEYHVEVFDDDRCRFFLNEKFSELHAQIFDWIPSGPIKADFWRVCVLSHFGGVYVDVDAVPLVPLRDFIQQDADFVTCTSSHGGWYHYNPNFIATTPDAGRMRRCVTWYVDKFTRKEPFDYWGWSVVTCFAEIFGATLARMQDGIFELDDGQRLQLLHEVGNNLYDQKNIFQGVCAFMSRSPAYDAVNHRFRN